GRTGPLPRRVEDGAGPGRGGPPPYAVGVRRGAVRRRLRRRQGGSGRRAARQERGAAARRYPQGAGPDPRRLERRAARAAGLPYPHRHARRLMPGPGGGVRFVVTRFIGSAALEDRMNPVTTNQDRTASAGP